MRKFKLLLTCCLLASITAWAQNVVKGKVTDAATGEPLPAVTVSVAGTKQGITTDGTGNFSLKVNDANNAKLLFSILGYKSRVIEVKGRENIPVQLETTATSLNDLVVIGYGVQKKSHLTGAVTKLQNNNLDEIPASRLDNALIGKMAGVTVQNVSPEAGVAPKVRVRGTSSISANADPLVVVDGYPVPDGLSFVNPYDVESIEVLKDAASAAIYGSRGANGVILITTKTGKSDKPRYTVKAYYGFKGAYELNPILTFSEYASGLYREAALRANDPTVPASKQNLMTNQERASYVIENQISGHPTIWQQEAMQDASIYNIQLGVSGGKKDMRYYVSGNVQQDQGIMRYSENNRANLKTKIDANLSKRVSFSVNFNPTYTKTQRPAVNLTDYYRFYSFLPTHHNAFTSAFVNQQSQWAGILPGDWAQARHFNGLPYAGTMPDGTYWSSNGPLDPFATSNNTPLSIASRETRESSVYRMLGGGDITVNILPGLIFKTSGGGYYNYQEDNTFTLSNARKDGDVNRGEVYTKKYIDLLWENTLNYVHQWGGHNVTGLLGYTAQKTTINESNMVGLNFPTDNFKTLNQAGQIDQSQTYTLADHIGLISYLGRITYDYKGKYLFSASMRADGSSYFAKGNKYGWFPSVSAGWRVSSEPFMERISWLSNLKLRGSYGATGNNKIASFSFVNLLYPGNYGFGGGTGTVNLGLAPNSDVLANPAITWERTFAYNAGIDIGLLKDRIALTLEYYNSVTDRLLFKQSTMSFSGSYEYWNNAGKVRNQGLEIDLTAATIKNKQLEWTTSFNLAANRNRLLELGGEPYQYNYGERNEIYAAMVGQPSIQFYGYKTAGVWKSDDEIAAAKAKGETSALSKYYQAGGLKYVDVNGDNVIDIKDRTVLGNPYPDFTWGLTNTLKYKGIDLSILIQGSQGGQLINGDAFYNETKKFNKHFNNSNRWVSAANPGDGKTPYYTNGEDWMLTDFVIEDASYAALRNVILGYTLPRKLAGKAKISQLRFYASADNVFYIMGKGYRGINPEARSTNSQYATPLMDGYQRGAFPISRTFTLGIDVNF